MTEATKILGGIIYARSQAYKDRLVKLERNMYDYLWMEGDDSPTAQELEREYIELVSKYGGRTEQSWELAKQLDKAPQRDTMQDMNLDNGIAHIEQQPLAEENDMAKRHKVQMRRADGTTAYITGETLPELLDNYAAWLQSTQAQNAQPEKAIPLLKDYAQRWYDITWKPKEDGIKNSYRDVRTHLHKRIIPHFGHLPLDEIRRSDIQEYASELQQNLSASTVDKTVIYLRQIFEMAVDDGLLAKNPVRNIDVGTRKEERRALEVEQVADIIKNLDELATKDKLLVAIPLYCGLRNGETLALCWDDIDWESHTININKAVKFCRSPKGSVIGSPKSKAGYRTVPLKPELEAILKPLQGQKGEYVITGKNPMTESANSRAWERIRKKINLYGATAHVFRHTFATFAAAHTDPKTLQYILGHSDIKTTMQVYVHARKDKVLGSWKQLEGMYNHAA